MNLKYNCPSCNSEEFITEPNQYDILIFNDTGFTIQSNEQVDDYKIFCRECGKEVDILRSFTKIVLKKRKNALTKTQPINA